MLYCQALTRSVAFAYGHVVAIQRGLHAARCPWQSGARPLPEQGQGDELQWPTEGAPPPHAEVTTTCYQKRQTPGCVISHHVCV